MKLIHDQFFRRLNACNKLNLSKWKVFNGFLPPTYAAYNFGLKNDSLYTDSFEYPPKGSWTSPLINL